MHIHKAWCVLALVGCAALLPAQSRKNYKDRAEYDLYSEVTKEFAANNFAKALTALDTWTQKYPESEFKDNRQILYIHAWYGSNQPAKALDTVGDLLTRDPEKAFDSPAERLKLLYSLSVAVQYIAEPATAQQATASDAARQLLAFDKAPQGMSPADWEKAKIDLHKAAHGALLYVALAPIVHKLKANDCAGAEAAARKTLESYPNSAQAAWYLGSSTMCLAKGDATKIPFAIYEVARAAALEPAKGMVDAKWQQSTVEPYLEKVYTQYHGADPEGLQKLKALASGSSLPPSGFTLESKTQIAQKKETDFENKNPEVALWMKLKAALLAANGDEYFNTGLKDSAMPKLVGTLVGATPECRPKELLVSIRTPDSTGLQPEITLKLDKALTGKPELQSEIRWEGVATGFAKEPFRLTVDAEQSKIEGIKSVPCGVTRKR